MKISQVIKDLEKIKEKNGDLPCLILINSEGSVYYLTVDELRVEEQIGYGKSVVFLE